MDYGTEGGKEKRNEIKNIFQINIILYINHFFQLKNIWQRPYRTEQLLYILITFNMVFAYLVPFKNYQGGSTSLQIMFIYISS